MVFKKPEIFVSQIAIDEFLGSENKSKTKYILAKIDFSKVTENRKTETLNMHYLGFSFETEPTTDDITKACEKVFQESYDGTHEIFRCSGRLYKNTKANALNSMLRWTGVVRIEDGFIAFPGETEKNYFTPIGNTNEIDVFYGFSEPFWDIFKDRGVDVRIKTARRASEISVNIPNAGRKKLKACPICSSYDIQLTYINNGPAASIKCCNCGTRLRLPDLRCKETKSSSRNENLIKKEDYYDSMVGVISVWNSLLIGKGQKETNE